MSKQSSYRQLSPSTARQLNQLREMLDRQDALWLLAIIGITAGLLSGLVVVAFRHLYEVPLSWWLPDHHPEGFENLPSLYHFGLPLLGGITLGIILHFWAKNSAFTGVAHVVHSAHNRNGRMPFKSIVVQFFAGAIALGSGQSIGREGPSVHLGAGISSAVGQRLGLPNNTLRILIGCGTAAGIAASFNTPIAGIIFAMEVVLMEYTIMGFMPIMLAAVAGTAISRLFYGNSPAIALDLTQHIALPELLVISLLAICTAVVSASFVRLTRFWLRQSFRPIWLKMTFAGFITGCLALITPEIMGSGHDTITQLLNNAALPPLIALIIIAKLLATSVSAGMGMPAGTIGPTLFIGACAGALAAQLAELLIPGFVTETSLYVILGMAAMMAATLNAPLAALLAIVEMTYSPALIFPGLLVICLTNICHRSVFKQPSIISAILTNNGITLATDPVSIAMQSRNAKQLMDRNTLVLPDHSPLDTFEIDTEQPPKWLIIKSDLQWQAIKYEQLQSALDNATAEDNMLSDLKNLQAINRLDEKATLKEAWTEMNKHNVNALVINYTNYATNQVQYGVLTRGTIERAIWQH